MKRRRRFRWFSYIWSNYPLFRVFGVPVEVNGTFMIFPFGVLVMVPWVIGGIPAGLLAAAMLTMVLCNVLIHEFAHVLTAARFGIATERVVILPFGCVALMEDAPAEPAEILIALAGPVASLMLALLGWGAIALTGTAPDMDITGREMWIAIFAFSNLGLGLFNLLPCFPMDGGRVLRGTLAIIIGLLWPRRASKALLVATRIAVRWFAWPIAIGIIVLTIGFTHLWHHLILFTLIPLAGEAELFCLKTSPQFGRSAAKLRFLPVTSLTPPGRQAGIRHGPWRGVLRIEEATA